MEYRAVAVVNRKAKCPARFLALGCRIAIRDRMLTEKRQRLRGGGLMSKRIVFCADGTWQAPLNNTNVYRLYNALTVASDQVTFYDDGVGADATGLNRVLQGAFGQGLLQKIQDGYTKIAHVYEPGNEIFLFGFIDVCNLGEIG